MHFHAPWGLHSEQLPNSAHRFYCSKLLALLAIKTYGFGPPPLTGISPPNRFDSCYLLLPPFRGLLYGTTPSLSSGRCSLGGSSSVAYQRTMSSLVVVYRFAPCVHAAPPPKLKVVSTFSSTAGLQRRFGAPSSTSFGSTMLAPLRSPPLFLASWAVFSSHRWLGTYLAASSWPPSRRFGSAGTMRGLKGSPWTPAISLAGLC